MFFLHLSNIAVNLHTQAMSEKLLYKFEYRNILL